MPSKEKQTQRTFVTASLTPGRTPAAHSRTLGLPVNGHMFKVGQTLFFSPSIFEAATRRGNYRVVALLPADGGDNQYRVKSATDGHERVVRESQLQLV
ncbi:MAG: hypothetical protein P4M00_06830 [Azospirillaceae bacterium]|nr:hypothetical protein [Azospirillaceae bacterium]